MLKSIYDIPKQSWYNDLTINCPSVYSYEEKLLYALTLLCKNELNIKYIIKLPDWVDYASPISAEEHSKRSQIINQAKEDYTKFNLEILKY